MGIGKGSGRGGARAGAGKKSVDSAEIVYSATVTVDETTRALLYELGNGNYSLGARRAAAELLEYRKGNVGGHVKRNTTHAAAVKKVQPPAPAQPVRSILRRPGTEPVLPRDRYAVYSDD
jgi:hypothetical protein